MKQIRNGIFETNSSSTHAICITDYGLSVIDIPETLKAECCEYGWENAVLTSPAEKLSYLYAAIYDLYDEYDRNKMLNDIYHTLLSMGCECEFDEPEKGYWGYAEIGIDHAYDLRDFVNAVMHSESRLKRYLFSPDSYVVTGNDNGYLEVDIDEDYPHEEYYKGN